MSDSARQKTVRLTMAQALVRYLQVQYSERDGKKQRFIPAIFGIFGHGNVCGLGQALEEHGHDLPYMQPCNEQSMVHTAAGFAKATLRKQTLACAASIGPGSTNMVTGAAAATINHIPVLLLPADYYATRRQGPVLQQLEHPISADVSVNDCFRPVSRFFDRICRPEQLLTALPEAMRILTDPAETGTVTIAIPQDIQAHAYDYPSHLFDKRVWRIERRLPDPKRIAEAARLLKRARRPMIIAGGGVHYAEAWNELQSFAETFGIPVSETFGGKGAMRKTSRLALGGQGVEGTSAAGKIAGAADLVIAIGTRLGDFATGSQSCFNNPKVKFIGINVTGHDGYKNGALPILADAREALKALHKAARAAGVKPNSACIKEVERARRQWQRTLESEAFAQTPGEAMSQSILVKALNDVAGQGDTVVAAAGGPPGDLLKLWDATGGRNCHLEFGYSCMGYELPAGLGVRMAQPKGEVYVLVGDGTYLMNPMELVTAMQEDLKITVVISENHGYQVIRRLQMWRGGRSFGNEFRKRDTKTNRLGGDYLTIDFARNAESMGARAWHVDTPEALKDALEEARVEKRSCVIVVETEKHRYAPGGGVWWDVEPAEATSDPVMKKIRKEYERERARLQRFYY
ncbi:MAG: 3D-(3,5/4)-trihydroxycyclohexane-1,2-dione acylhydrolase (decyclizing) [Candidatus Brocadiia bacterium]|nr:3D-(3,5/4)-trihydroxycyclohexane-1,2-dione acylhydrolase (decyclizing) [Candidatus Brocadiia bacterium]